MFKAPRIYIDTSVIGGCFDEEFQIWSNALIDDISKGLFDPVVSSVIEEEIEAAPEYVQNKFSDLIQLGAQILSLDKQALELMKQYSKHKIIPAKFRNDMFHIAIAVANVDILVSWNFKHIVRYDKIIKFNAVNIENNYHTIAIYSPREVTYYEKEI